MESIAKIKQSQLSLNWYVVDASGRRIGHVASLVANLLQQKNDTLYRKNLIPTAKVIIINSDLLDIPRKKSISKFYKSYSGYPGGLRFVSLEDLMKKDSRRVLYHAIKGMIPKNKRGSDMMRNLYIYKQSKHEHEANKPAPVKF